MGSHSVTSKPMQEKAPRLNLSHAGRYSIYLPTSEGRKSELTWVVSYVLRWFTCPQTVQLVTTFKSGTEKHRYFVPLLMTGCHQIAPKCTYI